MKEYTSLRLLDRFKYVFEHMGVDYRVMRRVLQTKLTLDGRRTSTVLIQQRTTEGEEDNGFIKSLWMYGLMGLFFAVFVFIGSPLVGLSLFYGALMFILTTAMVSDFSTVLLEVKDKNILSTKPVDLRTLNMAKFMHIFIYLSALCGALAGPGTIAGLVRYGAAFAVLMAVVLVFICLFTILLTSLLYTLLLKYFDGEKLKDVITIFQVVLTVAVSLGYQLVSRMFQFIHMDIVFAPKWWTYLIPPAWFAAPFEILVTRDFNAPTVILALMGMTIPIIAIFLHLKVVAPIFEQNISKLTNSERVLHYKRSLSQRIFSKGSQLIASNRTERAFVQFSQVMLAKERTTKLRMYPGIAMGLAVPLIMLVTTSSSSPSPVTAIELMRQGKSFLVIYLTAGVLAPMVSLIDFSDSYKGAWIYKVTPIAEPGSVARGATKGYVLSYILPPYLITCAIFLPLLGLGRSFDLLVVFLSSLLTVLVMKGLLTKRMPFSEPYLQAQANNIAGLFAALFIMGGCAGIHALLLNRRPALYSFGVILMMLVMILWKKSFDYSWEDLSREALDGEKADASASRA